jgi:hypothetical protein
MSFDLSANSPPLTQGIVLDLIRRIYEAAARPEEIIRIMNACLAGDVILIEEIQQLTHSGRSTRISSSPIVAVGGANSIGIHGATDRSFFNTGSINPSIIDTQVVIKMSDSSAVDIIDRMLATYFLNIHRQLPPLPDDFVDRSNDIELVTTAVKCNNKRIIGFFPKIPYNGMGTTSLAIKVAEELSDRTPDGQLYFDLKGSHRTARSVQDAQRYIIRSLFPLASTPKDPDMLAAQYRSALSQRNMLILMDDVPGSAEDIALLIPPSPNIFLFTSKEVMILPGQLLCKVGGLPPTDSCSFLLNISARLGDSVDAIAELCEYVPRALRNAGNTLARLGEYSPTEYIQRLRGHRHRFDPVAASLRVGDEVLKELRS